MGGTVILIMVITLGILFFKGIFKINTPSRSKYPVVGVDISSYQGEIDWQVLSNQDIQFAFIKATEGSSFVDKNFAYNFEEAIKTDLRVGAYHFFSYDSSGSTQANNFIANVPKSSKMLPPVVDVEFYGDKEKNLPDKDEVTENLTALLKKLEDYYAVKPIIYATRKSYKLYISGSYPDYDIWIRDVYFTPKLLDGREWTFWQYSDKGRLDGYRGVEKYIDLNVFNGSQDEFNKYSN